MVEDMGACMGQGCSMEMNVDDSGGGCVDDP